MENISLITQVSKVSHTVDCCVCQTVFVYKLYLMGLNMTQDPNI